VIYNILGNVPEAPQTPGNSGMTFSAWNNTIATSGAPCFRWNVGDGGGFTSVTISNTHCITSCGSAADASWNGTAAKLSGNIVKSPTAAASQGFGTLQTYAYSPTLSSNGTVGAGTNQTSLCAGALAGLCRDTTYAGARTTNARPASGAWDAGAYQFNGGA